MRKKIFGFALLAACLFAFPFIPKPATAGTTIMNAPAGVGVYFTRDGVKYPVNTAGQITIDNKYIADAQHAGFTPVFNYGSAASTTCTKGTMYNVPTAYSRHGQIYACYSTNLGIPSGGY